MLYGGNHNHDFQGGIFEGHPQRYAELAWTLFRIAFWMGTTAKTLCRLYLVLLLFAA